MRKLSWIIAGILSTATPVAALHAAQLGDAKVESKLTQPLNVRIPITDLKQPLDEVKVRLAAERYFREAGIPLDNVQGNLRFQIKKGKHGPYVLVTSRRPISDPILSFLLRIQAGNGSMIREYDLLLDPPGHERHVTATVAPAPTRTTSTHTAAKTSSKPHHAGWVPVKSVPNVSMGGTYKVKSGDTLYEIAKKAADGTKVGIRPMMQAIINANPKAFPNGNGNLMLAGAHLKVPESVNAGTASAVAQPTESKTQPKLQLLSANEGQNNAETQNQQTANNETASNGQAEQPAAGEGQGAKTESQLATERMASPALSRPLPSEKLPAIGSTAPAPTAEDLASIDAKNEAMSKQIALLNDQLKQLKNLTTTHNKTVEQLQSKIHAAEQQTESLQAKLKQQQDSFWTRWGQYLIGGLGLLVIFLLIVAINDRRRLKQQEHGLGEESSPNPGGTAADEPSAVLPQEPSEPGSGPMVDIPAPMTADAHDDVEAAVQEARLLVSYNLHGQAIDLLKDAIERHPNEPAGYTELAQLYADEGQGDELKAMLDRIEERFGPEMRPELDATDEPTEHAFNQDFTQAEYHEEEPADRSESAEVSGSSTEEDEGLDLSFEEPQSETEQARQHDPLDDIDFDTGNLDESEDQGSLDLDETASSGSTDELEPLSVDMDEPESSASEEEGEDLLDLDLPETETPATDAADLTLDEEGENESLSLSEAGAESDETEQPQAPIAGEEASQAAEEGDDTRLGLAEAFLSVGDKESFQMIAEELESEGNEETLTKLREIEQKHQEV